MTAKTSKKSAKVAKKVTSKRTTKAAKPRKAATKPSAGKPKKTAAKKTPLRAGASRASTKPKLLSGGNPQIPKGYGDEPVQAYIAATPGWKSEVGRRLDALIERTVPGVIKAVKWNSPFYGVKDNGWFLSYHCFAKYIKVAFFRGASLRPVPPVESKHKEVRYLHIHEDEPIDKAQLADWVKQASQLPGEQM
jgi:hypothetical protein